MQLASAVRCLQRGSSIVALMSLALAVLATSPADARRGEAPLATPGAGAPGVEVLNVTAPDVPAMLARDDQMYSAGEKRFRYAEPRAVSATPYTSGSWSTQLDGTRVWNLLVSAPDATDLNLAFTRFEVPFGAKLYVISTEEDYYEGPYTHEDNKAHGELWVPVIPGAEALIELQLPADTKFEPQLELTQVNYGYRDMFNRDPNSKQGACNNDVICPEGLPWADQIQSVAVYSVNGFFACTGNMVMDVPGSFQPFFLTAYHCGVTAGNAATLTVYWNYESPVCGQLSGGSLSENQTGATFLASRQDVDMCLVRLDAPPSPISNVYWAGWDRSNTTPSGSVGIHHPGTDEKAISFNTDPLTTINSCIGGGGSNTHWEVDDWEDGTTEPGSSGSPLFDPNNQLVIGFLSGGIASCSTIGFDCYGKFADAWDGPSAATRLRDHLDPGGQAPLTLQGSYPTGAGVPLFDNARTFDDCFGVSNGVCEPGETVTVLVEIVAAGGDITGISGVLSSSTPDVVVIGDSSAWPDLNAGVGDVNLVPFEVFVGQGVPCFSSMDFELVVNTDQGGPYNMFFSKDVGQAASPAGLPLAIPDNAPAGASSSFNVSDTAAITDLNVRVQINHTYVGDIQIFLTSPSSTTVTLLDRPGEPATFFGCSNNDMDVTFDDASGFVLETHCIGTTPWYVGAAAPVSPLSAFNGENPQGTWTLNVVDNAGADTGSLVDWELIATPGFSAGTCDICDPVVPVQLSSINVERNGWDAELRWEIARADGLAGFNVLRATDGAARVQVNSDLIVGTRDFEFVDAVAPVGAATYWLQEVTSSGTKIEHGPFQLGEAKGGALVHMAAGAPNPFKGRTSISYAIRDSRSVNLSVYDVRGRLVTTLVNAQQSAGSYTATWGGHTDGGTPVASGVYVIRLQAGDVVQQQKVTMTQ